MKCVMTIPQYIDRSMEISCLYNGAWWHCLRYFIYRYMYWGLSFVHRSVLDNFQIICRMPEEINLYHRNLLNLFTGTKVSFPKQLLIWRLYSRWFCNLPPFWGCVLFYLRSPKGGCCSILDDFSCSFQTQGRCMPSECLSQISRLPEFSVHICFVSLDIWQDTWYITLTGGKTDRVRWSFDLV